MGEYSEAINMSENMIRVMSCVTEEQLHNLIKELSVNRAENVEEIKVAVTQIKAIRYWETLYSVR